MHQLILTLPMRFSTHMHREYGQLMFHSHRLLIHGNYSDYTFDESRRPNLELTWRTGNQWLPSAPTGLLPRWQYAMERNSVGANRCRWHNIQWTSVESNETAG